MENTSAQNGGSDLKNNQKNADGPTDEILISKFVPDYAYCQLQLSKRAMDLCIFAVTGGIFTGYMRFLKGFYGLADLQTVSKKKSTKHWITNIQHG